ncbi:hypothetical protein DVH24_041779 [Malus domestica]|uniref:Uncharacterized protein n=1 Tax=Malus domestica TaxID=3750 RepID=A0A498IUC7_MALDO|nr:hypothetical protein DVH24_041779 [Malus domestica]
MAAEAVLTFAAEGILEKVLSLAEKEFSLAWGFKAELRKLKESFTTIELLLNDVAYKPQAPAIEEWVKKLKGVAEDAEDVLDEFKYEVDRRKVEIQNHMKRKVLNFFSLSNPLAFRLQMAHKIQKINASLVDLERKASPLGLVSRNTDATRQGITWDRRTDSLIGKDEITVGRKDDVSNIVKTLTDSKSNQENLAVMAIVGMGGLGKTTLAKSVYNENSIQKFFDKRIWICVSNPFDVNLILLHMLEHLNPAKAPSKDNKNALLEFLNEELKDKRYLLVLDDVWNEDLKIWDNLMECLSKLNSTGGSKIIVTTRSGKVASILKKLLLQYELGELSVDECWSIMKDKAFPINGVPEFNSNASTFETIGKEIAKNCGGVPLVAKVLGGILRTKKSIEEWSSFKNSRIWNNHSKEEDRIMSILRLSFDNLESPSLKQCFAYCSMFEKDAEIQRDNLIQLWMAQGLLRSWPNGIKDMEDIGNEYFDILLQSSLFQDATMSDNGIVSECKMHDLNLSIENCNGLSGPLSLGASLVEVILRNCNGLSGSLSLGASLVELTIEGCNNLTSIEMKGSGSLTASLQKLRIWFCNELSSIPALPQQCPSLQKLSILGCPKLSWFGVKSSRVEKEEKCISLQSTSDLRTMTSLRRMWIERCERLESWVSSLQFPLSLEYLIIVKIPNLEILPSLDHLNSLRYLEIGGFWEELDSFPDFEVGSLMHLTSLQLNGWPKLKSLPQQIQHLTSLTDLWIVNFEGVETLPEWLGSLTSLTYLRIQGCKNLMNLPSVQAMQRLTKLQTLRIYNCHSLLNERCKRDSGTDWPKISHIPYFRKTCETRVGLKLCNALRYYNKCVLGKPNIMVCKATLLRDYLYSSFMYKRLQMAQTFALKLSHSLGILLYMLSFLIPATSINILTFFTSFCAQSSRVGKEECISVRDLCTMTSLRQLSIENWIINASYKLNLVGWPKLKSLPQHIQHLTSLTSLIILSIDGVETLPEWLGSLTSLTWLKISSCKNLMNLQSVHAMQRLTKLQSLHISGCHPLLEQRCTKDSGTDWPKISHIPNIDSRIGVRSKLMHGSISFFNFNHLGLPSVLCALHCCERIVQEAASC